jgi:hypothetical protein
MILENKERLHQLVDELPGGDIPVAARFLEYLRDQSRPGLDWAEVRARLEPFSAEWDRPEMSIYDDYDSARAGL